MVYSLTRAVVKGFLFTVRSLYFLGVFGPDGSDEEDTRGRKKTRRVKKL